MKVNYPNTFWDTRYSTADYAYGVEPNRYFQQCLDRIPTPGRLLLLAEGEGRNAVYAAQKGWAVTAVDFSVKAKEKAMALAAEKGVTLDYVVADIRHFDDVEGAPWDAIALIYAHFEPEMRTAVHQKCIEAVRPGGSIILEAFNRHQLSRTSGGPKHIDMLYAKTMLQTDFAALDALELLEATVFLDEGEGHAGLAEVVRAHFQKPISA